jgi:hypothetical protein
VVVATAVIQGQTLVYQVLLILAAEAEALVRVLVVVLVATAAQVS